MTNAQVVVPVSGDLIYDIGLHKGEDTDFYLKKGFRVVAIEANPKLAAEARSRFSKYDADGRLTLVVGAVIETEQDESIPEFVSFYENEDMPNWGPVNKSWADRNARLGHESRVIQVPAVNLKTVMAKHGMPYYMKIDVEGCDVICLRALENFSAKPTYLSFESDKVSMNGIRAELELLLRLGYRDFIAVEQSSISERAALQRPSLEGNYVEHTFVHGCSGLFGKELPGRWLAADQLIRNYRAIHLGYDLLGDDGLMSGWRFLGAGALRRIMKHAIQYFTKNPVPGWYDTHARHSSARNS
jgi:FkbM family methyltransferase